MNGTFTRLNNRTDEFESYAPEESLNRTLQLVRESTLPEYMQQNLDEFQ